MTSVPDGLAAVLSNHYALRREIGRGGMATVYLVHDHKHDRLVALKVLRPELSHVLGRERFVEEVRIIARLQHPHIVPLFDSGEAAGLLWYTMPYVEGESLRQRIEREGQLSIEEALRISQNVLAALVYAHEHGIIHRDLKPDNILLESGEAIVSDFGIAHAVDAAGGDRLTASGLALGTPTYMSPEQAAGSTVDVRSDIYSLGCVIYEMLAGEPPFTGPSPRAVVARHSIDPVPPLQTVRPTVPLNLERAVEKALAKVPADRFATATEFAATLSTSLKAASATTVPMVKHGSPALRPYPRKRVFGSVALMSILVVAGALIRPRWHQSPASTLDPKVVAVVPFRVTGADSSLRYLREGMIDLLATRLSGTRDLRTVDPRTLLRAWHRAGGTADSDVDRVGALKLARSIGAGRLLEGEVIGTGNHVVLDASLRDAVGQRELRATVDGPSDSVTSLVDQLAAQLLVMGAGEREYRLMGLTSYSLPALREYLDGRAAHRQGDYATARHHFDRAIEFDSTFALAGIGRTMAAIWLGESSVGPGSMLAWRHRDRLSNRDLLVLRSMLGRRFPLPTDGREGIADVEALVASATDNPEAWASLGDGIYHYGQLLGMPRSRERSLQAFTRALALDSSYMPSLAHLHELLFELGDTAAAMGAAVFHLQSDSMTRGAASVRWFARGYLQDTTVGKIRIADDSLYAREVTRLAVEYGTGLAEAESVLTVRRKKVTHEAELSDLEDIAWTFYLVEGRPARAQADWRLPNSPADRTAAILCSIYADADAAQAARVAAKVPRSFGKPWTHTTLGSINEQWAAAQYDLSHGQTKAGQAAVSAWRGAWTGQDTSFARYAAAQFAVLLDAQIAASTHRPDAAERLSELDSVLQDAPYDNLWLQEVGNLEAARLWHERGNAARALASIRRRVVGLSRPPLFITYLREEGRYAALAGDRAGAIRAYRHYLTLRSDPEPAVRPKVEEVRAEIAALERKSTDR